MTTKVGKLNEFLVEAPKSVTDRSTIKYSNFS